MKDAKAGYGVTVWQDGTAVFLAFPGSKALICLTAKEAKDVAKVITECAEEAAIEAAARLDI